LKSTEWFELVNDPSGIDLTVTFEGTGAGTAKMFADGRIVLTLSTTAETAKYINLSTPIGMKVVDAYSIHADSTGCTWAIANTGSNIIPAVTVAAADNDIDRAVKVLDANNTFLAGDDDLRIDIAGAGAFLGVMVISTQIT
jgi:hypothetical protein